MDGEEISGEGDYVRIWIGTTTGKSDDFFLFITIFTPENQDKKNSRTGRLFFKLVGVKN
jgi:hypothetical protein